MKQQQLRIWLKVFFTLSLILWLSACSQDDTGKDDKGGKKDLSSQDEISAKVIYGDDNRLDLYEVEHEGFRHLAKSTAILVSATQLVPEGEDHYRIQASSFGSRFGLCSNEPFFNQKSPGYCSGFLVGPDTLVTAGHCIRRTQDCRHTRFMFGFSIDSANSEAPETTPASQVYTCTEVLQSHVEGDGADYAVVKLDRPVLDREPLLFRTHGQIAGDEELVVIGNPSGIPTKVAGGAKVRSQANGFFVADLDTYQGNSGSAVFSARTGLVEGILVRGESDFEWDGNCRRSKVCAENSCRGEDVTRITEALPWIDSKQLRH